MFHDVLFLQRLVGWCTADMLKAQKLPWIVFFEEWDCPQKKKCVNLNCDLSQQPLVFLMQDYHIFKNFHKIRNFAGISWELSVFISSILIIYKVHYTCGNKHLSTLFCHVFIGKVSAHSKNLHVWRTAGVTVPTWLYNNCTQTNTYCFTNSVLFDTSKGLVARAQCLWLLIDCLAMPVILSK